METTNAGYELRLVRFTILEFQLNKYTHKQLKR